MIRNKAGYLTVLCLFLVSAAYAETPGSLPLLKVAPDARSSALGEAGAAGSKGAMAAFHNPALLAFAEESQAAFAYSDWLLDMTMQSGALLFSYGKYSVGLSFNAFTTPDIERRVLPSDEPIETFSAHDVAAGLSFAYRLSGNLSLGLTARFIQQQIYVEEASGGSADLGAVYRLNAPDITLAAAVLNLGAMGSLDEERSPLPGNAVVGIDGLIFRRDDFGLRGLGDAQYFFDDDIRAHMGLEVSWQDHLFLRAGYQTGSESRSFSGGAGLAWNRYAFDYAYQPLAEDFEAAHRFAFSLNF